MSDRQSLGPRMGQELPFAVEEHERRIGLAQSDLRSRRLAGALLFDPENTFWLTGYQSIGYFTFQCLFLPVEGRPTLVSRKVNARLAEVNPCLETFVAIPDTADPVSVLQSWLASRLANAGLIGSGIGIETGAWYLTVRDYQRLAASLNAPAHDWNGVVEHLRLAKTEAELERMRRAARAAEAGMGAALEAIAPGKTENDVAAAMFNASIAAGSEYLGHPPLVVSGERTALCFAMWRRRELAAGDVVLLESGGCVDRYHALIARVAVLGKPTERQRHAATTIINGLEAAIEALRPGVRSRDVDAACRDVITAAGYDEGFNNRNCVRGGNRVSPELVRGQDHLAAARRRYRARARNDFPLRARSVSRYLRHVLQ